MTKYLHCGTCGQKLLTYENPKRLVCPTHGAIEEFKKILLADPKMDVDRRFGIHRKRRKK